ncbi:hypothetical protein GGE45_005284 [Rhizobium aethiopicum]|uniref:Uncharacterized protein n=1 Tax=Rhizobium aethiopicum TaxID=1138170 RepID=A0A7W6QAB5_9HYPH|nr:hypothetical protein [Rhizobium aethiopicum]MBB4582922.1 hypothetical protein [Rhizobium aethiopicum]
MLLRAALIKIPPPKRAALLVRLTCRSTTSRATERGFVTRLKPLGCRGAGSVIGSISTTAKTLRRVRTPSFAKSQFGVINKVGRKRSLVAPRPAKAGEPAFVPGAPLLLPARLDDFSKHWPRLIVRNYWESDCRCHFPLRGGSRSDHHLTRQSCCCYPLDCRRQLQTRWNCYQRCCHSYCCRPSHWCPMRRHWYWTHRCRTMRRRWSFLSRQSLRRIEPWQMSQEQERVLTSQGS